MKENDKTSHRAELMRDIVAMVNQNPVLKQAWQRKKEKSIQNTEFEYPEHLSVEHIDMGLFKMEYLTWNGSENPYVILQLHGGGYMSGLQGQYRKMAGLYAEISSGAAVLSVDYRLAPEHPFPAALEDAVADLAITGESYTKNREIDPVFGADGGGEMLLHSPYIGENDAKNPLISPMYGSFTGFPPMLIQVGTHEMLYDDAVSVAKKAKEQGVPVRFTVYEGMFHVFQMSGTVIPESKRAWEEVGAFMHKVMGQW